jgi:hypothetical protein
MTHRVFALSSIPSKRVLKSQVERSEFTSCQGVLALARVVSPPRGLRGFEGVLSIGRATSRMLLVLQSKGLQINPTSDLVAS